MPENGKNGTKLAEKILNNRLPVGFRTSYWGDFFAGIGVICVYRISYMYLKHGSRGTEPFCHTHFWNQNQMYIFASSDAFVKFNEFRACLGPQKCNSFWRRRNWAIDNMLWYSTHWTAPPFSNDPLWLTLFVEGVNDRLLDHCQVSSVPHYCGFKEQEILTIHTLWMVIYWNSNVNILIFWDTDFFTFISCKL